MLSRIIIAMMAKNKVAFPPLRKNNLVTQTKADPNPELVRRNLKKAVRDDPASDESHLTRFFVEMRK